MLIALLLFIEMSAAAAEFGQAQVLILDDVVQSVDSAVRLDFFDFLLQRLAGWQLLVVGHDRAWKAQLQALFRARGKQFVEVDLAQWTLSEGVQVRDAEDRPDRALRVALSSGDARLVAGAAGLLLEMIASELSWRLEASVIRREGDRYTLSDTWSGVAKRLRKTELGPLISDIEVRMHARNLLGAHYNDWASGISDQDVRSFGLDVDNLFVRVFCGECYSWIAGGRSAPIRCRCGQVKFD